MTVRVLGIDPGLRRTGYGVVESDGTRPRLVDAGIIAPSIHGTLAERLAELHAGASSLIRATQPGAIVIEELYTTYRNPSTAILMAHARGVLCLAGAQHGVGVHTLAHAFVKRALVGTGAASKEQVNRLVTQLLRLRCAPDPLDVSDALAIALAFINVREHERVLPAALRALR